MAISLQKGFIGKLFVYWKVLGGGLYTHILKLFTISYKVENNKTKHILYFNDIESGCIISHVLAFPVNREGERFPIIILLTVMLYYMHFWSLLVCLDNALVL